jgi:hypothetical protein
LRILNEKLRYIKFQYLQDWVSPFTCLRTANLKGGSLDYEILGIYSDEYLQRQLEPISGLVRTHVSNSRQVYKLKNVTVDSRTGVVYTSNGSVISQSTVWDPLRFFNQSAINSRSLISLKNESNLISISSNSFYHWLIEDLPSTIWLLEQYPNSKLLVSNNPPRYVKDFLKLSGREVIEADCFATVGSLIMVGKNRDAGWPQRQDLSNLRNFFGLLSDGNVNNKNIYISRKNATRTPVNEKGFQKMLESLGLDILDLNEFHLTEQISFFQSANKIIGLHGAGLANLAWCGTGQHVLEILNLNLFSECYFRLSMEVGLAYKGVTYRGHPQKRLNIKELEDVIGNFL